MQYLGLDGCKSGWFYVGLNQDAKADFGIFKAINELSDYLPKTELVLIDIPIGLRGKQAQPRLCDKQARVVLATGRKSSIFPSPSRCALKAETYAQANALNRAATSNGLSAQCYGILPKIREVDEFMRAQSCRHKIREMHPEVAFWALNRGRAMRFSKKSPEGFEERVTLLSRYFADAEAVIDSAMKAFLRRDLARDDIVDALVGAVTAHTCCVSDGQSRQSKTPALRSFPETPEIDEMGLPMEIVYAGFD